MRTMCSCMPHGWHGSLVVVQVIVFLSERQSTLDEIEDVHGDILLVGTEIARKHAIAHPGIFLLQRLQVGFVCAAFYLVEQRLYGSYALLVAAVDIDRQLVEVGQFLLDTSLLANVFSSVRPGCC